MRFQSAQVAAYLTDGLWLRLATNANQRRAELVAELQSLASYGVRLQERADVNMAFVDLPAPAIDEVAGMYRAKTVIDYVRGVPPVVNEAETIGLLDAAMTVRRGSYAIEDTEQSLGGEDFSWYLEKVPGAMARLGVRRVGDTTRRDLHAGDFDVDEGAIAVGVELFTAAALLDRNVL